MPSSLNNDAQTSLFAESFCESDSASPLISKQEKVLVRERCSGSGMGIIDCHHSDVMLHIDDSGGLDLKDKPIFVRSPMIEHEFPIIPKEWFNQQPESIDSDIVGIRLGDILSERPRLRWGYYYLPDGVRIDLSALSSPVFRGKRIVLFASGPDFVIEKLWRYRWPMNLFEEISKGNFYAVTGMNFSLFLHECPLGHLINLNKSLLFCQELSRLGVPVIPHVYAVNDWQRAKWIDYLTENPSVRVVTINTQLQHSPLAMAEVVRTVEDLLESTSVSIVLNGYRPKGLPARSDERVFVVNQQGLKERAIIEKALENLGLEYADAEEIPIPKSAIIPEVS